MASSVEDQRRFLKEHLGQATQAVRLELDGAEQVDSLGVTLIVGLYKSCKERGLAFSVIGVNAEVMRLFKFFSLHTVFELREK